MAKSAHIFTTVPAQAPTGVSATPLAGDSSPSMSFQRTFEFLLRASAKSKGFTAIAVLFVVAACGITLALGLPHTQSTDTTLFIMLDGGWRVAQGQRPHLDFYSALGPVSYCNNRGGLRVANTVPKELYIDTPPPVFFLVSGFLLSCERRLSAWSAQFFPWRSHIALGLHLFRLGSPLTAQAMQCGTTG